jgi:Family of unknown function (DUF6338)
MPEFTIQGLMALLILLPGFLTAELVRVLSTRRRRSEFDKVIQAFIYSFLVYVCFTALRGSFPITVHVESAEGATHYLPEFHFWPLLELTLIAGLMALAVATMMNHDFPLSYFQKWGITQRTFRPTVWNDCFRLPTEYVQVELADGRQVIGWLCYFSDTPEDASLYLEDAAWRKEDGTTVPIDGPGILITKESGIRSVMFLNAARQPKSGDSQSSTNLRP